MRTMIPAPEHDQAIGIDIYYTGSPGIGGRLKSEVADFQVDEIFGHDEYEGGRFLAIEVEKSNWDTHHLIKALSRALRISQKRFSFAGTKDKRAVTRQRMSIMGVDEAALDRISIPGVRITVLGRTNRPLGLGDLRGNAFRIRLRNLAVGPEEAADRMVQIEREIEALGGLPNYFGVQRFGDVRPITHLVGDALVRGDPELAVFRYLALPFSGEPESTRTAREALWQTRDIEAALKSYPRHLHYELAILNHLVLRKGDYAGSFNVLSPNLRRMFVHAYQSYLFNRILSRRIKEGISLTPQAGDVVCFTSGGLPDASRTQAVTEDNLSAVVKLSMAGRAFVTIPLIGHQSAFSGGRAGEIEREVVGEEGISTAGFAVPLNPELGSRGARRPAIMIVKPEHRIESNGSAVIEFFLSAGSYATVVLREYMKPGVL